MQNVVFQEVEQQNVTPMMRQYLAIKSQNHDHLLLYRMGDFYELFFEDAVVAAPILEITLTKRGKHDGDNIPMCGVPAHALDLYLHKLIKNGHSVAICEQLETPQEAKKRSYKAIVKREVVRIITPGTILEESLLNSSNNNYLASITSNKDELSLAWVELSTSRFNVTSFNIEMIPSIISWLSPKEIIVDDSLLSRDEVKRLLKVNSITARPHSLFDVTRTSNRLKIFFGLESLMGLGKFTSTEIAAAGALLEYIEYTQKNSLPYLGRLKKINHSNFLILDPNTKKHLEIEESLNGDSKASLLYIMNKTVTAMGSRMISSHIASPLLSKNAINQRLDNVEAFFNHPGILLKFREILKQLPDVERAFLRIHSKKCTPKDLGMIRDGLNIFVKILELLHYYEKDLSSQSKSYTLQIVSFDDIIYELKQALQLDLPSSLKDGDYIKNGYSPQLDKLRQLKKHSHLQIEELRNQYSIETGINNLKIQKNNVIGYFVEVSSTNSSKMQSNKFIHRQALGGVIRYITDDLRQLEADLLLCDEKISQLELELFNYICDKIAQLGDEIMMASNIAAQLDVATNLALIARENKYARPIISEDSNFVIHKGRHPLVEKLLSNNSFTNNDCIMDEDQNFHLITGPNMAGKSTFLRQNALIAIMAQIGSFIPAESAHIGIVDKIFSRIGSGDNISAGQSTFMVEMLETAYILNNATPKSLIILDEIGRGTSTYDGLSIAWSVIEYLHDNVKAKVLFSTHYHELTDLEDKLKKLSCYSMVVQEWEGKTIFLHKVEKGKAGKSYGINVAEMAGMPKAVIERAYEILNKLQKDNALSRIDD